jgi:peptidoglycan/LPS O-acetylase OafA/YrhL
MNITTPVLSPLPDHVAHLSYRPDIDGLRAIAVLSVVGFHAYPFWVRGGFVGVDIFFVISGFLISSIIFKNLDRGSFSFIDFYCRRIRRIFGALIIVLLFCFALGWAVLLDDEFKQLGKHIIGGAAFVSNFVLWGESGYFDTAAETKPLLHLWSLGIEEQFYIVWPFLLWAAWKWRFNLLTVTVAIGAVSFAINIWQFQSDPVADFYSPLTRFWELLAGAALAYLTLNNRVLHHPDSRWRNTCSAMGVLFLAAGVLFVHKGSAFPGFYALLPVLGAVLVLTAGPGAWFNRAILSSPILVWFGLISYPLYLWHWPLLSFARIVKGEELDVSMRTLVVLLSIALAWLTYRLIERPLRFGTRGYAKAAGLTVIMVAVAGTGYFVVANNGLKSRSVVQLNSIVASSFDGGSQGLAKQECGIKNPEDQKAIPTCISDVREPARLALVGDSKALALINGLMRTSHEGSRWLFVGGTKGNAVTVPAISKTLYGRSQQAARIALDTVKNNPNVDTVLIASAARELFNLNFKLQLEDLPTSPLYEGALEGMTNFVGELVAAGKKVVLLIDNPTLPDPKNCIIRKTSFPGLDGLLTTRGEQRCVTSIERHLRLSERYLTLLRSVSERFSRSVTIIDTVPMLCDTREGRCASFKNGRLLYEYTDHISDYAAGLIGSEVNASLGRR